MGEMADYYGYYEMPNGEEDAAVETYWVTHDKRRLRISDMDDDHLTNTIAFLERRGARAMVDVEEGARDGVAVAESLMSKLDPLTVERYKFMLGERERRKKDAERKADDAAGPQVPGT